jgi:hypothetical protein
VDRLNLSGEEVTIQPVHPSIMGQVQNFENSYLFQKYTLLDFIEKLKVVQFIELFKQLV